jgi:hypothetical protein
VTHRRAGRAFEVLRFYGQTRLHHTPKIIIIFLMLTRVSNAGKRIPDWARNGRIAYCRWDGGPLEVAKAHLSNWVRLSDWPRQPRDWMGLSAASPTVSLRPMETSPWREGTVILPPPVDCARAILTALLPPCGAAGIEVKQ